MGRLALVKEAEWHHNTREPLLLLNRRDPHNPERHDDVAPAPKFERPVDAREEQRIADLIRSALRRLNRDLLERRGARALCETMMGRRRGGSQDMSPGQPLALAEDA